MATMIVADLADLLVVQAAVDLREVQAVTATEVPQVQVVVPDADNVLYEKNLLFPFNFG